MCTQTLGSSSNPIRAFATGYCCLVKSMSLSLDGETLQGNDNILFSQIVPTKPKPYFYHFKLIFLVICKLGVSFPFQEAYENKPTIILDIATIVKKCNGILMN